ncbi:MAG: hypothetical protein M3246_06290 [Actinomycetota bacterium]|nr:hypothetical protein [Actinomycetota bacterium]
MIKPAVGLVGKPLWRKEEEKRMCARLDGSKSVSNNTRAPQEEEEDRARRVLQAAIMEAFGRAGVYALRDCVMQRANISELEEFWALAEYLDRKGWIAEGDDDYSIFVVTAAGVDEVTNQLSS